MLEASSTSQKLKWYGWQLIAKCVCEHVGWFFALLALHDNKSVILLKENSFKSECKQTCICVGLSYWFWSFISFCEKLKGKPKLHTYKLNEHDSVRLNQMWLHKVKFLRIGRGMLIEGSWISLRIICYIYIVNLASILRKGSLTHCSFIKEKLYVVTNHQEICNLYEFIPLLTCQNETVNGNGNNNNDDAMERATLQHTNKLQTNHA